MKTPQTITDSVFKLLSVRYNLQIALKRSYDNWALWQFWENKKRSMLCKHQKLKIGTHEELGPDLAVARFVIDYCRGQVRDQSNRWLIHHSDLPSAFKDSFKVTAVKVNKSKLVPEGIDNFVGLNHIEFLDLSDNPKLDDFACDQLARQFRMSKMLKQVNLSHNPLITLHGLDVMFRIPSLERLVAIDTQASNHDELDIFILSAKDERKCEVICTRDLRE